MLRHVALFRWIDDVTPEQVDAVSTGLGALPAAIPELRAYRFGPDLGLAAGNFGYAVVADVDDADAWAAYTDHPAHRAVIAERIRPILASRAAVQLTLDEPS